MNIFLSFRTGLILSAVSIAPFMLPLSAQAVEFTTTITVNKIVINDNGGELSADSVALFIDETSVTNGSSNSVSEGTHVVSETNPSGYTATFSGDCDASGNVTVVDGDNKTCTITNDDDAPVPTTGTLVVTKHVVNDNGGTNVAGDFTLLVHEEERYTLNLFQFATTRESGIRVTGSEEGESVDIYPGEYSVTESEWLRGEGVPNTYTPSFSEGCSGSIAAGQTITCIVTNSDPGSPAPSSGGGGGHILVDQAPLGGGGGSSPAPTPAPVPTPTPTPTPIVTPTAEPTPEPIVTPRVLGDTDVDASILTCRATEPESMIVTAGLEEILRTLNMARDARAEQVGASVLANVHGGDVVINNFASYGTYGTQHLGAGERAGVIDSYLRVYGHVPRSECDWQDALRIAKGLMPIVRVQEREAEAKTTFKVIYKREATVQERDEKTVWMMAYGLRPAVRSLPAERRAIRIYRSIFGHNPRNSGEWDTMRAIAYGGVPVPGFAIVGE
ncbi:hypothetical protein K8R04_02255 [Candidatus Uhrbacteria bacterium]|nr:hypothetical protein [Candidatus Uhrbacteria bacterium]